jgi:hypothetical protein
MLPPCTGDGADLAELSEPGSQEYPPEPDGAVLGRMLVTLPSEPFWTTPKARDDLRQGVTGRAYRGHPTQIKRPVFASIVGTQRYGRPPVRWR